MAAKKAGSGKKKAAKRATRTRRAPAAPETVEHGGELAYPSGDQDDGAPGVADELDELVPGAAGEVPNLDAMIGESVGASIADSGGGDALDELTARIAAENAERERVRPVVGTPGIEMRDNAAPAMSAPVQGEVKRGRGRPRKDGSSPAASSPVAVVERDGTVTPGKVTKDVLAARVAELEATNARLVAQSDVDAIGRLSTSLDFLLVTIFGPLAMWRGAHWEMDKAEARTISEPLADALAPQAQEIQDKLPWAAPLIALVAAVGKRIMTDLEIERQAEARAGARSLGSSPVGEWPHSGARPGGPIDDNPHGHGR